MRARFLLAKQPSGRRHSDPPPIFGGDDARYSDRACKHPISPCQDGTPLAFALAYFLFASIPSLGDILSGDGIVGIAVQAVPIIDEALPERLVRRILRGRGSLVSVFRLTFSARGHNGSARGFCYVFHQSSPGSFEGSVLPPLA